MAKSKVECMGPKAAFEAGHSMSWVVAKSKGESAAVLAQRAKQQKDCWRTLGLAIKALRELRRTYAKTLAETDAIIEHAMMTRRNIMRFPTACARGIRSRKG